MKLWDIIKGVGGEVVKAVVPGGGIIMNVVNELLPDGQKLSEDATGADLEAAINSLPPDQKAALLDKEFDVELTHIKESHSTVRVMLESDAKNPHTTRPYIAKHAFHVIAFAVVVTVSLWSYAIAANKVDMIKAVTSGWPFILSVIGPLVILLHSYFGVLKREGKDKLDAAGGQSQPSGIASILSLFKGK